MSPDGSRRFTDREVAMIIRAASEIDEKQGADGGGGLSVEDVKEIASEVGISPEAVSQAVARLDTRRESTSVMRGAPVSHKAVHAVRGELNETALGQLIRLVDEETDSTGTVSEALGSVRWTSGDRFHSMQVSLTPQNDETVIQVVDKIRPRLRNVIQWMPVAWGAMLAAPFIDAAGQTVTGVVLALAAGVAVGGGIGRFVWSHVSARNRERVERLAAELSRHAYDASMQGLVVARKDAQEGD